MASSARRYGRQGTARAHASSPTSNRRRGWSTSRAQPARSTSGTLARQLSAGTALPSGSTCTTAPLGSICRLLYSGRLNTPVRMRCALSSAHWRASGSCGSGGGSASASPCTSIHGYGTAACGCGHACASQCATPSCTITRQSQGKGVTACVTSHRNQTGLPGTPLLTGSHPCGSANTSRFTAPDTMFSMLYKAHGANGSACSAAQ